MMPSLSLSSSPSSVSTTIKVDKATSELLAGPDWTMNMEICDLCNSNHWMSKDVVKGVKRRLHHRNSRVQLLTLTLLETMVKNCGEYIHYQISERKVLDEMIKIVKKKGDFHVRDKILLLLDSWQEAFGGPGGKYSQYNWACDELRRCGVQFPQRSPHSAPVITPPVTHSPIASQVGFGMPANSLRRLEEAMTSEAEGLSFSTLESMRNALELLNDMLQAVNPSDRMAIKDEVIVDIVDRCRINQKKLMQMITTTTDEDLLAQGLEMNDSLQSVLAKHDAIASGAPLPDHGRHVSAQQSEPVDSNIKTDDAKDKHPAANGKHPAANGKSPISEAPVGKDHVEEEEEEDEFALLARRHSKSQSGPSQSDTSGATEDGASSSGSNNALALIDASAPPPATTTSASKEQDLIDLLSIVLTTNPAPETPQAPSPAPAQNAFEASSNSYVVPWAQPKPQPQPQQMVQSLPMFPNQYEPMEPQAQQGYFQYASAYPPPPWEGTPAYSNNQNFGSNPYLQTPSQGNMNYAAQGAWSAQNVNAFQYPQYGIQSVYTAPSGSPMQGNRSLQHSNSFQNPASMNNNLFPVADATNGPSSMPTQGLRSLQHTNSFPVRTSNGSTMNGTTITGSALNGSTLATNGSAGAPSGQKPFIPSYRLFEDLNVLSGAESKLKSGPYPSASGNPNQNMIAGRR